MLLKVKNNNLTRKAAAVEVTHASSVVRKVTGRIHVLCKGKVRLEVNLEWAHRAEILLKSAITAKRQAIGHESVLSQAAADMVEDLREEVEAEVVMVVVVTAAVAAIASRFDLNYC